MENIWSTYRKHPPSLSPAMRRDAFIVFAISDGMIFVLETQNRARYDNNIVIIYRRIPYVVYATSLTVPSRRLCPSSVIPARRAVKS